MATLKELEYELQDPEVKYALGEDERASLLEALKDAARYRLIREFDEASQRALFGPDGNGEMPWGAELDEAIDAELKRRGDSQ